MVIQGLQPKFKNYVKLADPSTVRQLLECPAARDDFDPGSEHTTVFQALVDQVASLQATIVHQQAAVNVAATAETPQSRGEWQSYHSQVQWQPRMPYPQPALRTPNRPWASPVYTQPPPG